MPSSHAAGAAAQAFAGATRVSLVAAALAVAIAAAVLVRRRLLARATPTATPTVETWGCAFAAPTARMQYTGSSFAALLVDRFRWAMALRGTTPRLGGAFPRAGEHAFRSEVPDTVLDLALLPVARGWTWVATHARGLYLRRVQFQMLLVLLTLLAVLAWGFAW